MVNSILPTSSIKNTFGEIDYYFFKRLLKTFPDLCTLLISLLYSLQMSSFSIYFSQFNLLLQTETKAFQEASTDGAKQPLWQEGTSLSVQWPSVQVFNRAAYHTEYVLTSSAEISLLCPSILQTCSENIIPGASCSSDDQLFPLQSRDRAYATKSENTVN